LAARWGLDGQHGVVEAERIQLRQQAGKGGLAGRRKEALGIGPHAQGAALMLGHPNP